MNFKKFDYIIRVLIDNALQELDIVENKDIPVLNSDEILFVGDMNDTFHAIPQLYKDEKSRKWIELQPYEKVLIVNFKNGECMKIVRINKLTPVLLGARYKAIVAPSYTLKELQNENIDLGILANYYITNGEN